MTQEGKKIIKHKGLAKSLVNEEWFESQYDDISRTTLIPMESNFKIDWEKLNITKKKTLVNLGIRIGNKREPVYDNDQWVDTVPLDVTNLAGQENRIVKLLQEQFLEHLSVKDRVIADYESKVASLTSEIDKSKLESLNKPYQDKAKLGNSQSDSAQKANEPKIPTYYKKPFKGKKKLPFKGKKKLPFKGKKKKKKPG